MTQQLIHVGDRVRSAYVLNQLPAGTIVHRRRNDDEWTRIGSGQWQYKNSTVWNAEDVAAHTLTIKSFPDGSTLLTLPSPTLLRVQWDYLNGATAAARHHGVTMSVVKGALDEMGIGKLQANLGTGVRVSDPDLWNQLPEGSVVYSGSPNQPRRLSVQAKQKGRWVHVLGDQPYPGEEVVVDAVAGLRERPDWLDAEGTDEDVKAIDEFRATAYRVGYRLKRDQRWCSTYEHVVGGLGITDDAIRRVEAVQPPGQRVQADAARHTMPVGTLLWWQNHAHLDQFALYVRDATSNNLPGTRRVFASEAVPDNEQYKRYMTVASAPDGNGLLAWRIPEALQSAVWDLLPVGSTFTYRQGGTNRYMICRDRQACEYREDRVPEHGQWQMQNFGDDPGFMVRSIGYI